MHQALLGQRQRSLGLEQLQVGCLYRGRRHRGRELDWGMREDRPLLLRLQPVQVGVGVRWDRRQVGGDKMTLGRC